MVVEVMVELELVVEEEEETIELRRRKQWNFSTNKQTTSTFIDFIKNLYISHDNKLTITLTINHHRHNLLLHHHHHHLVVAVDTLVSNSIVLLSFTPFLNSETNFAFKPSGPSGPPSFQDHYKFCYKTIKHTWILLALMQTLQNVEH